MNATTSRTDSGQLAVRKNRFVRNVSTSNEKSAQSIQHSNQKA